MFFFHKKKLEHKESLILVGLLVFVSIMFSVSAYFQFKNIDVLSQNIRGLAREVQNLQDQTLDTTELQIAQKSLVGIERDVPVLHFSGKDVKGIFENPEFALSKLPTSPQPFQLVGSGVVIDKDRGIVATSYHVVNSQLAHFKIVTADHQESVAKVLSFNAEKDLALLQVEDVKILASMMSSPLSSNAVMFGDDIVALGFSAEQMHIFKGQVIYENVVLPEFPQAKIFRTNFKIDAGDSGGMVLNGRGELIGLLTAFSVGEEESLAVLAEGVNELKKE